MYSNFLTFVKRKKRTMSYKIKHIVNKILWLIKKKQKNRKAEKSMAQKRDLTWEKKKIVNNLGLPVFCMIIFHNCTTHNKLCNYNNCWLGLFSSFVSHFNRFLSLYNVFMCQSQTRSEEVAWAVFGLHPPHPLHHSSHHKRTVCDGLREQEIKGVWSRSKHLVTFKSNFACQHHWVCLNFNILTHLNMKPHDDNNHSFKVLYFCRRGTGDKHQLLFLETPQPCEGLCACGF